MMSKDLSEIKKLSEKYGSSYIENCTLKAHSTIGIGGMAELLYRPSSEEELAKAMRYLGDTQRKFFISGNGSNVLFPDEGFDGVVVKLNKELISFSKEGNKIVVSSGLKLSKLLGMCVTLGVSGLECMSGIPATVGGALKNNASSGWGAICEPLERIFVLGDDGKSRWFEKKEIRTAYRSFSWPGGGVILRAVFKLAESSPVEVKNRIRELFMDKCRRQPYDKKTLGCVFKNPEGASKTAWELIDGSGMRGKKKGGAVISEKHANFIVNELDATSSDVKDLIGEIRSAVDEKFNVRLEEEIEIL